MKTILFTVILMMISMCSFSQDTSRPIQSINKTNYLKKAKKQQTIAFGLLGGGAFVGLSGFLVAENSRYKADGENQLIVGSVMFFGGLGCMVASIPLLILSSENKRKTREITIKMQQIDLLKSNTLYVFSYPALTIRIGL